MDTELELAKVRLNSAQDSLMDAQLTWAHAHRDWLQAVNKIARSENNAARPGATVCKACGCYVCAGCGEGETTAKKGGEVGPHTNARDSQGLAHGTSSTHGCSRCCSSTHAATPTGTHATQVPASTRVDTTSRK